MNAVPVDRQQRGIRGKHTIRRPLSWQPFFSFLFCFNRSDILNLCSRWKSCRFFYGSRSLWSVTIWKLIKYVRNDFALDSIEMKIEIYIQDESHIVSYKFKSCCYGSIQWYTETDRLITLFESNVTWYDLIQECLTINAGRSYFKPSWRPQIPAF